MSPKDTKCKLIDINTYNDEVVRQGNNTDVSYMLLQQIKDAATITQQCSSMHCAA